MTDRDLTDPLAYEYVGGGYFRLKGVPRGQKGHAIHGAEYMKLVEAALAKVAAERDRYRDQIANSDQPFH